MLQSAERVIGLQRVNDFVVKFANVNGSGSASANALFAKTILRMGVPVTPRNIFPSNIQGLPTWYEVRISEAGHLGARGGGVDLMVAMNPETWKQDIASIVPGGYLFYDNTKPMPPSRFRDDIVIIGVPLVDTVFSFLRRVLRRQNFAHKDVEHLHHRLMRMGHGQRQHAVCEIDPADGHTRHAAQYLPIQYPRPADLV